MKIIRANEAGVKGNGDPKDGSALQSAIDEAAASGGGMVLIPPGLRCETGTLSLKSHVELRIERGGAIVASLDPARYADKAMPALLEARGAEDLRVTGEGSIEGRAPEFMVRDLGYIWEPALFRPRLLCFYDCKDVRIEGVSFLDSPFWTVHLLGCERVDIEKIVIENDLDIPNCDGIDPDHCRDVRIHDCRITCADDAIVIKTDGEFADRGPSEDIRVSDCILKCTAGAIKIGTGTASDCRNMFFSDCVIRSSSRGISIQLRDQGNVENISFSDMEIETRLFEHHYWGHAEPIHISAVRRNEAQAEGKRAPYNPENRLGSVRGVRFSGIRARSEGGIVLYGSPESPLRDIELDSIDLLLEKWSKWPGGYIDLRPMDLGGSDVFVDPAKDPGRIARRTPGLLAHCVRGLRLRGLSLAKGKGDMPYLSGPLELEDSDDIRMEGFEARGFAAAE